ncbi:phosphate signaling complex protein PhoU [Pseudoruegeria sp. SK021]|uniref:phosphate signaling complex protein PhoU n=1 Tax=Pseudoruegeria sp. SK021 TaxID=1933035 RepID=UPI000A24C21E|nr:phosphate signaling complex protein PhoU [Pseudoruegeria sp. SK021]OSP56209.1 phosphate transport system regulatory protein PhoU [Pseudoruegeria sp. SK021]
MANGHISSVFDRELEAVQAHIMRMGGLVETSILDAAKSLETRDEELAEEVRRRDLLIDELEIQINEEAARLIALRAPVAVDLRTALSVMKISGNLERIGDFSKNMAKRTFVLAQMNHIPDAYADIRRMAQMVELMLKDALDAYIRRDLALAHDVRVRDAEVDQMYNAMFRQFLTFMMEDPRNITGCMHLHFIAKNTERMGDHVTSIADQVIYLITGEMPADDRPKGDRTAFMTSEKEG